MSAPSLLSKKLLRLTPAGNPLAHLLEGKCVGKSLHSMTFFFLRTSQENYSVNNFSQGRQQVKRYFIGELPDAR